MPQKRQCANLLVDSPRTFNTQHLLRVSCRTSVPWSEPWESSLDEVGFYLCISQKRKAKQRWEIGPRREAQVSGLSPGPSLSLLLPRDFQFERATCASIPLISPLNPPLLHPLCPTLSLNLPFFISCVPFSQSSVQKLKESPTVVN